MEGPEKKVVKKVWSGYECPVCFGVFRVPKGNESKEVICPKCEAILRLREAPELSIQHVSSQPYSSQEETLTPVLKSPVADVGSAALGELKSGSESKDGMVKKRRRRVKSSLDPDWERSSHAQSEKGDWKIFVYLLAGGALLLTGSIVAVKFLGPKQGAVSSRLAAHGESLLGLDDESASEEESEPKAVVIDIESEADEIIDAVSRFLDAKTLDETLTMVRKSDGVIERIRKYHSKNSYAPVSYRSIGENGQLSMLENLVSVNVLLDDFSVRSIALEKVGGRFLVDWESWVGYSKMSWEEFLEVKPRRARKFRVLISQVDYYNFDFSDDAAWKSFLIRDCLLYTSDAADE